MAKGKLSTMRMDDIRPYPNNPRRNDGAVVAVAESIRQCGYVAPIIVDEDGVILAGHTRYKALQKLGYKTADVLVKSGMTEEQKKKYRLLDNKTSELAQWDFELLADELADMDFYGLDLEWGIDITGENECSDLPQDDEFQIVEPREARTKRGDVYILGTHRVMCGDATSEDDVKTLMGGAQADLLLTDPPYNVALGMGGSHDDARKRHRRTDGLVIMNDKMDNDQFREFLKNAFEAAKGVMRNGAYFYVWHADSEGYNFRGALMDAGLTIRQNLIWVKNAFTLGRQDYQWRHEPCLCGWKDGAPHLWCGGRAQSTVLEFDRPSRSEEHPTMKPVPLFALQIQNSTKQGGAVLDLFGGSGTTVIAAEQLGRKAFVMEIDPKYCDVIVDRWEKATGRKAVLENVE